MNFTHKNTCNLCEKSLTHTHTHTSNSYLTFSLIFMLSLMFVLPTWASTCEEMHGTTITGKDGTSYCQSRIQMNWWSAVAWCQSLGNNVRLIDMTQECDKFTGTADCPNLNLGRGNSVWTINVPNGNQAYRVDLSSGSISGVTRLNYYYANAFCK